MDRRLSPIATLLILVAAPVATSHAQYYYPPGYGGYGWGGWGAGTVQGSVAQGLGHFAAGAGAYNERTAAARSINADTAMRFNEYMWRSQQNANRLADEKAARDRRVRDKARNEIYLRLRNNPEPRDVEKGSALNVALDELNNPKVYVRALPGADTKIGGALVRDIPFLRGSAAITASVRELTKGGPPAALAGDEFKADREALKRVGARLREEDEADGSLKPETLQEGRDVLKAMHAKVEARIPAGTRQRREAEDYIKALYGLSRMLETPAINILLAGVEKRPDTTIGELLDFMKAFNLRFGVASTPRQRQVYAELYPLLVKLRDQANPNGATPWTAAAPADHSPTTEFFSGMDLGHLKGGTSPVPPGPGPR